MKRGQDSTAVAITGGLQRGIFAICQLEPDVRIGQCITRDQLVDGRGPLQVNADMGPKEVRELCELDKAGRSLIRTAMKQMNLSARAYDRVLKVSRTIADLSGSERITSDHVGEAVQLRSLDRQLWA